MGRMRGYLGRKCPGCKHDKNRHVGGMCYGPPQEVRTPLGYIQGVSYCPCGYSLLDNDIGVGYVRNVDVYWGDLFYRHPEDAWWEQE